MTTNRNPFGGRFVRRSTFLTVRVCVKLRVQSDVSVFRFATEYVFVTVPVNGRNVQLELLSARAGHLGRHACAPSCSEETCWIHLTANLCEETFPRKQFKMRMTLPQQNLVKFRCSCLALRCWSNRPPPPRANKSEEN